MSLALAHFKALPLARYEFRLRACADTLLPAFLGSTLRGSFGHALKAIACSVRHQDCRRCLLAEACQYPLVFEPSALPTDGDTVKQQDPLRPFVFQPPLPAVSGAALTTANARRAWREKHIPVMAGTQLSFGLTLFGSAAIARLPYIIYAVELMARHGLGASLAPFELEEVLAVDERGESLVIYAPQQTGPQATRVVPHKQRITTLRELVAQRLMQLDIRDSLTLFFITPAWIEISKEMLESVDCEQLCKRLSWRMAQLFELYGDAPLPYDHRDLIAKAATVRTESERLWTHRFERYSNRRRDKTPMQGFLGEITYRGAALEELLPFVVAGEFLQLGKETAFGLGRYLCAV